MNGKQQDKEIQKVKETTNELKKNSEQLKRKLRKIRKILK